MTLKKPIASISRISNNPSNAIFNRKIEHNLSPNKFIHNISKIFCNVLKKIAHTKTIKGLWKNPFIKKVGKQIFSQAITLFPVIGLLISLHRLQTIKKTIANKDAFHDKDKKEKIIKALKKLSYTNKTPISKLFNIKNLTKKSTDDKNIQVLSKKSQQAILDKLKNDPSIIDAKIAKLKKMFFICAMKSIIAAISLCLVVASVITSPTLSAVAIANTRVILSAISSLLDFVQDAYDHRHLPTKAFFMHTLEGLYGSLSGIINAAPNLTMPHKDILKGIFPVAKKFFETVFGLLDLKNGFNEEARKKATIPSNVLKELKPLQTKKPSAEKTQNYVKNFIKPMKNPQLYNNFWQGVTNNSYKHSLDGEKKLKLEALHNPYKIIKTMLKRYRKDRQNFNLTKEEIAAIFKVKNFVAANNITKILKLAEDSSKSFLSILLFMKNFSKLPKTFTKILNLIMLISSVGVLSIAGIKNLPEMIKIANQHVATTT